MYFIWHRWGHLVLALFVAAFVGTQWLVDARYGEGFYAANGWPKVAAMASAAVLVAGIGFLLNRNEREWNTKHKFFYLPMEYWSLAFATAAAVMAVRGA
jgi:hypothetical protein